MLEALLLTSYSQTSSGSVEAAPGFQSSPLMMSILCDGSEYFLSCSEHQSLVWWRLLLDLTLQESIPWYSATSESSGLNPLNNALLNTSNHSLPLNTDP